MSPHRSQQFAFLGMGSMGQAISTNVIKNGNLEAPLLVWNRTAATAQKHAEKLGADKAEAVEDLATIIDRADFIWSCVASQAAVESIYETVLSFDSLKGKLFVESSTVKSHTTDELAEKVVAKGGEFVAMPVFGEPSLAIKAQLVTLPAGPKSSVEKVIPYLKGVVAKAFVNMGGLTPGAASRLKVCGNIMIVQLIECVAEAHVLADKSGIDPKIVDELIQSVWPGPMAIYSNRMVTGGYYKDEPIARIPMAKGVASHVLAMADETDTLLDGYKVAVGRYDKIQETADKEGVYGDITGIYGNIRQQAGLPFQN